MKKQNKLAPIILLSVVLIGITIQVHAGGTIKLAFRKGPYSSLSEDVYPVAKSGAKPYVYSATWKTWDGPRSETARIKSWNTSPAYSKKEGDSTVLIDIPSTAPKHETVTADAAVEWTDGEGNVRGATPTGDSKEVFIAQVKVQSVDVEKDKIEFELLPNDLPGHNVKITVKGTDDIVMKEEDFGGGNQTGKFDWSKFPQTPGQKYDGKKIQIDYVNDTCSDKKDTKFTGYGVFRITKYVMPNDDIWNGPLEPVSFSPNGKPPYRMVHTDWIRRVREEEGLGFSQGECYKIRDVAKPVQTSDGRVAQYLIKEARQGAYIAILQTNHSLAKQRSDSRFSARDKIILATDIGTTFSIDDTGNWQERPNAVDRYAGPVGPSDPNNDFPQSYIVKLPK